jgi:hypothetical protein
MYEKIPLGCVKGFYPHAAGGVKNPSTSRGELHQLVAPKSDEGGTRKSWLRVCAEDLSTSTTLL